MSYSPQFEKEYEDGWEDFPSEDTLITAHSLNMYDDTFEHIEDYLEDHPIAQTATMPTASASELGNVYQFVGETTATFTQGFFYKCVSDEEEDPTYSWQNINVQSGGGGGNTDSWTGTQAEYEAQASQIEDGTQVNITDDEERVEAFHTYSTDERVVGEWIDGKPVYEKTYILAKSDISSGESTYTHDDNLNIDTLVNVFGTVTNSRPLVSYHTNNVWATSIYNIGSNAFWLYIGSSVYSGMSATSQIKVTLQYTKSTD